MSIQPKNIPVEMKDLQQWVLWNKEFVNGRPTKVPKQASGRNASATNPDTWTSFDEVLEVSRDDSFTGIGFVFSKDDPFVGIDFDNCVDKNGQLTPKARELVEWINSYTEYSPSGEGVHIISKGVLPGKSINRLVEMKGIERIEMYGSGRYFTMTGRIVCG